MRSWTLFRGCDGKAISSVSEMTHRIRNNTGTLYTEVTLTQPLGSSFATTSRLFGTAWRRCVLSVVCQSSLILAGCIGIPVPYKGYTQFSLKGRVVESNSGLPIENAHITLLPWGDSTLSDVDGRFCLHSPKDWQPFFMVFPLGPWDLYLHTNSLSIGKNGYMQTLLDLRKVRKDHLGIVFPGWLRMNYSMREHFLNFGDVEITAYPKSLVTD